MMLTRWQRPELTSWPVFGRLSDLRNEIDRLFETPFAEFSRASSLLGGWMPALDLNEDKDHFTVKCELPGMKKDDINLTLHEGCLTISGERRGEQARPDGEVHRAERFVGRFQRTVLLPAPVAVDKISAQYKDGVLTVTLPKTEEAKPKQIEVKVG
ncbi:MAG TPA: Hsp20/alpha crystallin family protein [Verrucomicrobiota bacterium]|nr:Hsp20/alpha crystallin family protein [Verrucomicrobiota bacterium]OQB93020.1 MAG: Acid shock protein [Verrucomicrobia bacterium ADurb.Bin118]HPY29860.1 Hsp20/alpha crystallin family protein [Verrucomicrobiota bacterium]HQB16357.1 Hsp20/alpha crystallin family protein [Verrucomicrobiota bacterium]